MKITVVDKKNLLSSTLRAALDSQNSLTATVKDERPEIIVSSHTHGGDSVDFLRHITKSDLRIPVLVIAERVSICDVRQILTTGAAGILFQQTAAQHISWAIPAISSGCRVVSPEISESMISEYLKTVAPTPQEHAARESVSRLSRREQEVLHLLGRGISNREIAHTLFISPETVKDHVRAIRSKLGASTRIEAAQVAWIAHGATAGSTD
ncbi:MAG: response regulator transcription factor [Streptomyces sp.]|nr:response regulator transcription factor [Streptomyces sp.]